MDEPERSGSVEPVAQRGKETLRRLLTEAGVCKRKRRRVEGLFTTTETLPTETSPKRGTSSIDGRRSVAFLVDVSLDGGEITCLLEGLYTRTRIDARWFAERIGI